LNGKYTQVPKDVWHTLEEMKHKTMELDLFQKHLTRDNFNEKYNYYYTLYEETSGRADVARARERVKQLAREVEGCSRRRGELHAVIALQQRQLDDTAEARRRARLNSPEHFDLNHQYQAQYEGMRPLLEEREALEDREGQAARDLMIALDDFHARDEWMRTRTSHWTIAASLATTLVSVSFATYLNQSRQRTVRQGLDDVRADVGRLAADVGRTADDVGGAVAGLQLSQRDILTRLDGVGREEDPPSLAPSRDVSAVDGAVALAELQHQLTQLDARLEHRLTQVISKVSETSGHVEEAKPPIVLENASPLAVGKTEYLTFTNVVGASALLFMSYVFLRS